VAAAAAVIFGRLGGPSSTSTAEAGPWILRRSSTLQGSQVVRPRIPGGGRRRDCFVGRESSSSLLSGFGGNAWRSPATSGGDTRVLDCFFLLFSRVFFEIRVAFSSNSRFLRARDEKGHSAICTRYVFFF
jgi:hypothetical protein